MSYDGQRMKCIIMKRAGRRETFEAFVCCGNLNERTWLTDARTQSLWWQASVQNPVTNISCWVEQRSKNLGSLEDVEYGLAADICHVYQKQKGSWERRCCIEDIETETVILFFISFAFGCENFTSLSFQELRATTFSPHPKQVKNSNEMSDSEKWLTLNPATDWMECFLES